MDHTKLASQIRLKIWLQDQQEYAASNMSVEEWCKYKNISRNAFFYRQRKLRIAAAEAVSEDEDALNALTEFVEIPKSIYVEPPKPATLPPATDSNATVMKISMGGTQIDICGGISTSQLKLVLEVIKDAK